jgi:hypothetical protein
VSKAIEAGLSSGTDDVCVARGACLCKINGDGHLNSFVSRWQGLTEAKRIAEKLVWKNMLEQSLGQAPPCVSKGWLRVASQAGSPKKFFEPWLTGRKKPLYTARLR